ncbi:MAG: peptidylprolyl isomerase [Candidatus Solibacter usitatus]|nr:peptidylprolyl isomerase [Candidatus Solibacter usitatus]
MRICVLAICVSTAGFAQAPAADVTTVEQIIAKVNGDIITRSDMDRARREMQAQLKQRGATPQQVAEAMQQNEKDALRERIDNLLLVQRGKELNINVDAEVTKYLAQIQLENKIAEPDKFQQWIREQTGMTFEDFKQEVKNGILTQRVVGQEVYSKVNIPREEIEAYYEKNKATFLRKERIFLREILVSTQDKDDAGKAAAEKKAKDLVARARRNERFSDLVRDNSEGLTAKQGGVLDPYEKGVLNPAIERLVWDRAKGYVTDPIKLDSGWLILRVDDHQKEGQADLADVENEIKERIGAQLMTPKMREYLTELRRMAFLEIREGYTDTGSAPGKDTRWVDPALLKPESVTKEEVASQARTKRILFMIPVPGTKISVSGKSSSK